MKIPEKYSRIREEDPKIFRELYKIANENNGLRCVKFRTLNRLVERYEESPDDFRDRMTELESKMYFEGHEWRAAEKAEYLFTERKSQPLYSYFDLSNVQNLSLVGIVIGGSMAILGASIKDQSLVRGGSGLHVLSLCEYFRSIGLFRIEKQKEKTK